MLTNAQVYNDDHSQIYADADVMREQFHRIMHTIFGAGMPMPPAMAFQKGIYDQDPPEAVAHREGKKQAAQKAKDTARANAKATGQKARAKPACANRALLEKCL